jgi:hypothetical protein
LHAARTLANDAAKTLRALFLALRGSQLLSRRAISLSRQANAFGLELYVDLEPVDEQIPTRPASGVAGGRGTCARSSAARRR